MSGGNFKRNPINAKRILAKLAGNYTGFSGSVTIKAELLTPSQKELEQREQEILNQQHQALKQLTKQWLEEGDKQEQNRLLLV